MEILTELVHTLVQMSSLILISTHLDIQGVPYYWARFVFVIFSGSTAHSEELCIAIG